MLNQQCFNIWLLIDRINTKCPELRGNSCSTARLHEDTWLTSIFPGRVWDSHWMWLGHQRGEYTKIPNFRFHATMELGRLHGALKPWYKLKYSIIQSIKSERQFLAPSENLRNKHLNNSETQRQPDTAGVSASISWLCRSLAMHWAAPPADQHRDDPRFQTVSGVDGKWRRSWEIPWKAMESCDWDITDGEIQFFNDWDRIQYYLTFLVVDKRDEYETIWLKHDQSLN